MNPEKLKKLQADVRLGGKGTPRRKKKVVHKTTATDDKKLQGSLKKLAVNTIPNIEEVNMMRDDGTVLHFNNPRVQASLAANTFAVTGHAEDKVLTEMLPGILNQLGSDGLNSLRRLAERMPQSRMADLAAGIEEMDDEDGDDDVPDLVDNFDEPSKYEGAMWFVRSVDYIVYWPMSVNILYDYMFIVLQSYCVQMFLGLVPPILTLWVGLSCVFMSPSVWDFLQNVLTV